MGLIPTDRTINAFSGEEKRDPIKEHEEGLRTAGESLEDSALEMWEDRVVLWGACAAAGLASFEWLHWLGMGLTPKFATFLAIVISVFAALRYRRYLPLVRDQLLGSKGERSVGQLLERELAPAGYRLFHNIPCDGYDVDHVLVGPAGVFAVETKTVRKRSGDRVIYDGERITVGGHEPDRDPIQQAEANARRVKEELLKLTGKTVAVRPVVLYPGWFVEKPHGLRPWVWVLNPKALQHFLDYEPDQLSKADINLFAERIRGWINTANK
jgi:hypothetical protein